MKKRKDRARELEGIDTSNIMSSSHRRTTSSYVPPPKPKIPIDSEDEESEDTDDDGGEEDEENDEGNSEDLVKVSGLISEITVSKFLVSLFHLSIRSLNRCMFIFLSVCKLVSC